MRPPAVIPGCVHTHPWASTGGALRSSVALLSLLLLIAVSSSGEAPAKPYNPSQYDVQAIYLYNFAKFVRWPAGSRGTLDICVAGEKNYIDTLSRVVTGERIDTRPLSVRAVQRPEDEAGCGILFIGVSEKERLGSLLAAAAGRPVLTVSDIPGFLDRGGMIQFLTISNRVRFSVDLQPALRSGIALSSELLKVAVDVRGQPTGGGEP